MNKIKRKSDLIKKFNKQAGKCFYCKKQMTLDLGYEETAERDHVIPKSIGGTGKSRNIVISCHKCNTIKGNKYPYP